MIVSRCTSTVLACTFLVSATACDRHRESDSDAALPLSHVKITAYTPPIAVFSWSQDIAITLARDARLSELVDTRIFDGLDPGMTIEQAQRQVGAAQRLWTDDRGRWAEYRNQWGTLEIGCERPQSVPANESACNWRVYARPNGNVDQVFARPITTQLDAGKKMIQRARYRTIILWTWDHTAILSALIEDERITKMQLLTRLANR